MTQTATTPTDARDDAPPIVETYINEIRQIATLPDSALKVIRLTDDPEANAKDVNKVIACDPALMARILKIANSTFYGLPRRIGSIERAILLLGLDSVRNIVIAASLHKVFGAETIGSGFDPGDLWIHSVAVAIGARELAAKAGLPLGDEAFLAGLMHDVGIMVEMQACRPKFVELIKIHSTEKSVTFREAENRVFGATHELFGAGLCRSWKFPTYVEYVAGYHHRPMRLPEEDRALPALVHVADVLAARAAVGYSGTVEVDGLDEALLSSLNLGEFEIEAVAEALPEAVEEAQHVFSNRGS